MPLVNKDFKPGDKVWVIFEKFPFVREIKESSERHVEFTVPLFEESRNPVERQHKESVFHIDAFDEVIDYYETLRRGVDWSESTFKERFSEFQETGVLTNN